MSTLTRDREFAYFLPPPATALGGPAHTDKTHYSLPLLCVRHNVAYLSVYSIMGAKEILSSRSKGLLLLLLLPSSFPVPAAAPLIRVDELVLASSI